MRSLQQRILRRSVIAQQAPDLHEALEPGVYTPVRHPKDGYGLGPDTCTYTFMATPLICGAFASMLGLGACTP